MFGVKRDITEEGCTHRWSDIFNQCWPFSSLWEVSWNCNDIRVHFCFGFFSSSVAFLQTLSIFIIYKIDNCLLQQSSSSSSGVLPSLFQSRSITTGRYCSASLFFYAQLTSHPCRFSKSWNLLSIKQSSPVHRHFPVVFFITTTQPWNWTSDNQ